jgi:hypothetical protein
MRIKVLSCLINFVVQLINLCKETAFRENMTPISRLALQDFLLPQENIKFHSETLIHYANKKYKVIITDKRFILYARRGHFLKSDDIISERLDSLSGLEYSEKGIIFREAKICLQGTTKIDIHGPVSEIKSLFHTMESLVKI